ncbi:MAG TPA: sugar phosphate nucleotidyltransferase [Candidatus Kapabacteria bacterium]|nr:sugar phosphate nucleotidyltransferase [Candidatus Kapabacteria bacterium]
MKLLIFAGGVGSRLWPLSRTAVPKQFVPLVENTTTLQMTVDRVKPLGEENVYICTNAEYIPLVKKDVPRIPTDHIFGEPARRDLAAAVGLCLMRLKKTGTSGTVALLWADHFMKYPDRFVTALSQAEQLITENPNRFVFFGEEARFPNHNLGWIHLGNNSSGNQYEFLGWKYRPDVATCVSMFESKEWVWNPGYFVFDIDFVLGLYKQHMPDMYASLERMVESEEKINAEYATLPEHHFDEAIVQKIDPSQAVVLKVDLGWSDPGTLYALKEAIDPDTNHTVDHGNVVLHASKDSLVWNTDEKKLVAGVGLDGMVIVNTPDIVFVCPKDAVPEIKALLANMKEKGLQQYL